MADRNDYKLEWFQILTYYKTRYVIYGFGQWWLHLMDWNGCNFHHGRLPDFPVFETVEDAVDWLTGKVITGEYKEKMILSGHHAGAIKCSKGCDNRRVSECTFTDLLKEQD